jgi:hypothetical protein
MTIRNSVALLILAGTLGLGACQKDDPPSQWEIISGTATLELSAAVDPTTHTQLATYPTRTGSLTIADDSTVSGWVRIAAGDTVDLVGILTHEGGETLITFDSLVPAEYSVITNGDFRDTYALLSTSILYSNVNEDPAPENHRLYWQFSK